MKNLKKKWNTFIYCLHKYLSIRQEVITLKRGYLTISKQCGGKWMHEVVFVLNLNKGNQ